MFVFLQEVNVTLLRDELQQLHGHEGNSNHVKTLDSQRWEIYGILKRNTKSHSNTQITFWVTLLTTLEHQRYS